MMKRKFFHATALCGAMFFLLSGTLFTACTKDYDDDLRIQRELIENNEKELRATIDYYQTDVNNLLAQLKLAYENADAQQQIEIDAAKAKLTELAAALKTAESNISSLSSNYEAFKAAVEADFNLIRLDIQQLGIRIDGIDYRLQDAEAAIAEMEAFRLATEEKIERMKQSQEASAEAIKELEAQLQVITTALQSLQDQHNALKEIVAQQDKNLRDKINALDTDLRDKINALNLDITNMNTTLTNQINELVILIHSMGNNGGSSDELKILIENLRTELTGALNEYKIEIDAKFETIDSMMDDINGSITNLADRMDELEADIAALKGRIQGIRWIPSYWDAMLPLYCTPDLKTGMLASAKVMEEVYVVCNDPNIIKKITAPDSPYKVEVVANEVSPVPTRAIVENNFSVSKVEAGSTPNALKVTVDFLRLQEYVFHCFETYDVNGKFSRLVMKYRIAIKITDGKGNIALGDFIQVYVQLKVN